MAEAHENLEERLLHRLLFFTDAVFAIVITLLVLELKPPEEAASGHVTLDGGHLFAFALSFAIVAIFWVAHMAVTRRLLHFDWPTAVANLVFLFPICLIPFVSAWVGEGLMWSTAWLAYSVVLIATSLANVVLVLVQSRDGGRLLITPLVGRERAYRLARAAAPGLAFAVGLAGALADRPLIATFCWILIPILLAIFRLVLAPRKTKGATA